MISLQNHLRLSSGNRNNNYFVYIKTNNRMIVGLLFYLKAVLKQLYLFTFFFCPRVF